MTAEQNQLVGILNELITTCHDGEMGYRTAAECVKNHALKKLFDTYSSQRGLYAGELQAEVRRLGGEPDEGGSVTGALLRGWTNIKSLVTGGQEGAIISECERGEDTARQNYEAALKADLPEEVRTVVQRQFAGVKEAQDRIRALEVAASKL